MPVPGDPYAKILERLYAEVARIDSGVDWKRIAAASRILNRFSPRNAVLVAMQACRRSEEVTHLAGYRNWQRLGRQVRSGERGYAVLAPVFRPAGRKGEAEPEDDRPVGFRWVTVFDVSQTEGPDLAPPLPVLLQGESMEYDAVSAALVAQAAVAGFETYEGDLQGANGLTDFLARRVTVRSGLSGAQRAKTMAHELAHIELHAQGIASRQVAEIEAETTAYLVMANLGLATDDYSFPYIANWARGDLSLVVAVAERSQAASRTLTSRITERLPAGALG
ncbi:MAG: ArdC-like ssDNA-binding domain-containing protein [Actinomycetota bacterium]|nr:ArdC-like ssDNA-binding domain-containing protein [Actinomycetota bacterium]MDA8208714.1 ArdC-like ssDNA-binding domain-containing protein [Actinomycetota bacterium]